MQWTQTWEDLSVTYPVDSKNISVDVVSNKLIIKPKFKKIRESNERDGRDGCNGCNGREKGELNTVIFSETLEHNIKQDEVYWYYDKTNQSVTINLTKLNKVWWKTCFIGYPEHTQAADGRRIEDFPPEDQTIFKKIIDTKIFPES